MDDPLEPIIQQASTGKISRSDAEAACSAQGIEMTDLYNRVALMVAKRFHAGTLSYEDGDAAMNAVFYMMTDDAVNGHPDPFVQPAWSIYLAFDEGEYCHGGSTDPVETFTRPQIRHVLDDAQQIGGPAGDSASQQ
jgi:hypothetical protein